LPTYISATRPLFKFTVSPIVLVIAIVLVLVVVLVLEEMGSGAETGIGLMGQMGLM